MWKRILIVALMRTKEFYRDRSSLGWNYFFPFFIILAFNLIFNGGQQSLYKVGILGNTTSTNNNVTYAQQQYEYLKNIKFLEFIPFDIKDSALDKLNHHRIDILINLDENQYWVSQSSPKGYLAEKLLIASGCEDKTLFEKQKVQGKEIKYVEWLFPGILGMNMMFSCLYGAGYAIVRYRKNGVLKRMSVTPLKPYEFLIAQILSRLYITLSTSLIIFVGCSLVYGFECSGSYLNLFFVFSLGGFSMISLGLLIAARGSSEEFAGGLINILTWPMMILSEVWFSLEGARPSIITFSKIFPLTHLVSASRKIINDGAGLIEIRNEIVILTLMSFVFIVLGSFMFKWHDVK
ncbi:MAG: ABC transporter permease [Desulfobacterales bacterium]|nr:ABC transporter permease [Desulfobacterales bacterium]